MLEKMRNVFATSLVSTMTIAVFAVAQPALASLDIDGTPWSLEFDGAGHPADQGWQTFNYNSGTYNDDYKLGTGNLVGWLTSNGNPGGQIGKDPNTVLTKEAGWTVEWRMVTLATQTLLGVQMINDSNSMLRLDYSPTSITLRDGYPVDPGNTSQTASVDWSNFAEHTFRLVRQPAASAVDLYIDDNPLSAAQVSPLGLESFNPAIADSGNVNSIYMQDSRFEASYDFYRFHSGATIPVPEPASLALLSLGGMAMLRRKR